MKNLGYYFFAVDHYWRHEKLVVWFWVRFPLLQGQIPSTVFYLKSTTVLWIMQFFPFKSIFSMTRIELFVVHTLVVSNAVFSCFVECCGLETINSVPREPRGKFCFCVFDIGYFRRLSSGCKSMYSLGQLTSVSLSPGHGSDSTFNGDPSPCKHWRNLRSELGPGKTLISVGLLTAVYMAMFPSGVGKPKN